MFWKIAVSKSAALFKIEYAVANSEAALYRCSWEKLFWKYAANLQENTHVEVQFW